MKVSADQLIFSAKLFVAGMIAFALAVRIGLPNPYWDAELRPLTGLDQPVIDFLSQHDNVADMESSITEFLEKFIPSFEADRRSYLTVAIGCTGGQHRSVYMVERLAKHFRTAYPHVQIRHREVKS